MPINDDQIEILKNLSSSSITDRSTMENIYDVTSETSDGYIKDILTNIFNTQTTIIHTLYKDDETLKLNKKALTKAYDSKKEKYYEQKDSYLTNKRFIEIINNKNKITEFTLYLLKISLIVCACLLVFPILYKLKIMNKKPTLIAWGICILIMVLIVLYFVYLYNNHKNKNNFNKINFPNPDESLISQSKIDVDLSDGEKARCSAFSEIQNEYDVESLNNFDVEIYKPTEQSLTCTP
jgi:hypothetical protein